MTRKTTFTTLTAAACVLSLSSAIAQQPWTQTSGPQGAVVTALAADRAHAYAGVYDDIYRYDDGAARWIRTGSFADVGPLVESFTGQTFLVAGGDLFGSTRDGIVRSTDQGATWSRTGFAGALFGDGRSACVLRGDTVLRFDASAGWQAIGSVPPMTVAPVFVDSAAFTTQLYGSESYRSDDGMTSWRRVDPAFPMQGREPTAGLGVVLSAGGRMLYACVGGAEIFRSADAVTWENITRDLPSPLLASAIASDDDELVLTTNAGVFRFHDDVWTRLDVPRMRAIAFSGSRTLVATYGGIRAVDGDGERATPFSEGLIAAGASALGSIGEHVFASTPDGISRSTDHGASWQLVADFATWTSSAYAEADGALFACAGLLHRSLDSGATWAVCGPHFEPTWDGPPYRPDINGIAALDGAVYIAAGSYSSGSGDDAWAGGGVWRSVDGGVTWDDLSSSLPHYGATCVPVHGIVATRDYLLVTTARGVYRSVDGGAHWTHAGSGLPLADGAVAYGEITTLGSHHYLRAADGFFETSDGGVTWTPMRARLPESTLAWSGYSPSVVDDALLMVVTAHPNDTTFEPRLVRFDGAVWTDITRTQPEGITLQSFVRAGDYVFAGSTRNGVWRAPAPAAATAAPARPEHAAHTLRCAPLPATDAIVATFTLAERARVELRVVDERGARLSTIDAGALDAGAHSVRVPIDGLASGAYFVELATDRTFETVRLIKSE